MLASNLFLFLVFGTFLIRSGASDYFTDLCLSFLGTRPGGGAKAAVGSSFITASISGSASANVAITGSITIPIMMKTGYRPAVAAGIEAAASTGGTIMPPVMGASAFIMVALTGFSYGTIVIAATIPALLYFLNVYLQVHFYARRNGLKGLPAEDCPSFRRTLKQGLGLSGADRRGGRDGLSRLLAQAHRDAGHRERDRGELAYLAAHGTARDPRRARRGRAELAADHRHRRSGLDHRRRGCCFPARGSALRA